MPSYMKKTVKAGRGTRVEVVTTGKQKKAPRTGGELWKNLCHPCIIASVPNFTGGAPARRLSMEDILQMALELFISLPEPDQRDILALAASLASQQ